MTKYNYRNYNIYKSQIDYLFKHVVNKDILLMTNDEIVIKFMPLVEHLAMKQPKSQQASGVLSLNDLIQEGGLALCEYVDKINWDKIKDSDHPEKTLASFLKKRIFGAIRRSINIHRGSIRIPEYIIREARLEEDKKKVAMFFNAVFSSLEENENYYLDIPGSSAEYNNYNDAMFTIYLDGLIRKVLNDKYYYIIKHSYGIDCEKLSNTEIANNLGIINDSAGTRISQLKREALNMLIDNIDKSQVIDFL